MTLSILSIKTKSRSPLGNTISCVHRDLLILDEPTRGVDVGAREEMFNIIGALVESGMAVLLISSDLAEVLDTSHRIAVYRDGRILQTAPATEITAQQIMPWVTNACCGGWCPYP